MAVEFEKVRDIIVKQLDIEKDRITRDSNFIDDLGADSIDTVELVMAFENEFGIEIPTQDAEKLRNVEDLIKYIELKL
ncbi:MAG: acyl carrier protein [Spirochaetes bacterium]|nr:acyl carrier protein [Spirochaetota bacterium]